MRLESRTRAHDALTAAEAVIGFVAGKTIADYSSDLFLRSAVERQLEIIGEALSVLRREDPDTAARIPNAAEAIGLRNQIAHGYESIDDSVVWHTATDDIPPLSESLHALMQGE